MSGIRKSDKTYLLHCDKVTPVSSNTFKGLDLTRSE